MNRIIKCADINDVYLRQPDIICILTKLEVHVVVHDGVERVFGLRVVALVKHQHGNRGQAFDLLLSQSIKQNLSSQKQNLVSGK